MSRKEGRAPQTRTREGDPAPAEASPPKKTSITRTNRRERQTGPSFTVIQPKPKATNEASSSKATESAPRPAQQNSTTKATAPPSFMKQIDQANQLATLKITSTPNEMARYHLERPNVPIKFQTALVVSGTTSMADLHAVTKATYADAIMWRRIDGKRDADYAYEKTPIVAVFIMPDGADAEEHSTAILRADGLHPITVRFVDAPVLKYNTVGLFVPFQLFEQLCIKAGKDHVADILNAMLAPANQIEKSYVVAIDAKIKGAEVWLRADNNTTARAIINNAAAHSLRVCSNDIRYLTLGVVVKCSASFASMFLPQAEVGDTLTNHLLAINQHFRQTVASGLLKQNDALNHIIANIDSWSPVIGVHPTTRNAETTIKIACDNKADRAAIHTIAKFISSVMSGATVTLSEEHEHDRQKLRSVPKDVNKYTK